MREAATITESIELRPEFLIIHELVGDWMVFSVLGGLVFLPQLDTALTGHQFVWMRQRHDKESWWLSMVRANEISVERLHRMGILQATLAPCHSAVVLSLVIRGQKYATRACEQMTLNSMQNHTNGSDPQPGS